MARQSARVFASPLEGSSVDFIWDDATMLCTGVNVVNPVVTANAEAQAERIAAGQSGAPLPLYITLQMNGLAQPLFISAPPGTSGGFTFPTPVQVKPATSRFGNPSIDLGIVFHKYAHVPVPDPGPGVPFTTLLAGIVL